MKVDHDLEEMINRVLFKKESARGEAARPV